ncbi:sensor histidine kinase [Haliea sp. E17]|uniref:sensor histidine kinase n=1 Tax=Haliea sp. E17 TaxID=3401576 RepID=UPI003AAB5BC9
MGSPHKDKRRGGETATGDFFIPDLCGPRPVFMLVLLSELLVLAYVLAESGLPRFDWGLLATTSLIVQWISLGSAMVLCLARRSFSRFSVALVTVASMAVVALVTALVSLASIRWLPWLQGFGLGGWWLLRNILLATVCAGIALRYFYLQQQLRHQEKLEIQSRLDSLRARIRPHFLFNTLNTIASLIDSQPVKAERSVEDLAELFRASLKEAESDTTVADELRLCQIYLDIEELRLGERLQVDWQVEGDVVDALMPSLLLQPLVENAVYHGVARIPAGGCIRIALARQDDRVRVVVENPVAGNTDGAAGNRMALANIAERLRATFGADAALRAVREDDRFRVELEYSPVVRP